MIENFTLGFQEILDTPLTMSMIRNTEWQMVLTSQCVLKQSDRSFYPIKDILKKR